MRHYRQAEKPAACLRENPSVKAPDRGAALLSYSLLLLRRSGHEIESLGQAGRRRFGAGRHSVRRERAGHFGRRRTGLADAPADQADCGVPARRLGRSGRSNPVGAPVAATRPECDRRQQGRRVRLHRHGVRGCGAGGWLHIRCGIRHARRQPEPDPEPDVRHAEGPGPGGAGRHLGNGAGDQRELGIQDLRRCDRCHQGQESRQLRLDRLRQPGPPGDDAAGQEQRRRLAARALQGRRSADERRRGGPRPVDHRHGVPDQAAHRQQAAAAPGGDDQQAIARTAGRADRGRERLSRLRRSRLVGGAGAGEDAA